MARWRAGFFAVPIRSHGCANGGAQDLEFVKDAGDLDECNGRTGVTPEEYRAGPPR